MDALAEVCENIARHGSRLKKVAILADYFSRLSDADLVRAVQFLGCGPGFPGAERKFSVGSATLRQALLDLSEWDEETVALCYREAGDSGETISLLLEGKTREEPLSLAEAELYFARLANSSRTSGKVAVLRECFSRHRPRTLKYWIKVITGNFRIGLQAKMVEEAAALSAGAPVEDVRAANNRQGNLPRIALAARQGLLHTIEARLFHPMEFMLAKPLDEATDLGNPRDWLIEDKYDGVRSQAHFEEGRAAIYTRGLEEVTPGFPEIAEALRDLPGSGVLDGEILAWRDGRALAFTVLQQRIARKQLTSGMMAEVPVIFMAYDLLYRNGAMLVDQPVEGRRHALEQLFAGTHSRLLLTPQGQADEQTDIETAFTGAKARGNEGLILKRRGSLYESGKRSGAWQKLKRAYGTLDVAITAAEQGHGRRAVLLSDYTFGVRSGDRFVNVGKAYSGLTDAEVRELTRILRSGATERFGRVLLVKPEVVLEVAFDGVQRSTRHKGGYALRFPRILAWRRDKRPADCDTIERVRELYEASLAPAGAEKP